MKKVMVFIALLSLLTFGAFADTTVLEGFEATTGWNSTASPQNKNIGSANAIALDTTHVTQGTNSLKITLSWKAVGDSGFDSAEYSYWPGTAPDWGCRVYNLSFTATASPSDLISIDIYNDSATELQFAPCFKDLNAKLIRSAWRTLAVGANTITFTPATDGILWASSGTTGGNITLNSLLFAADNFPGATNVVYVDNLTRTGQTDVTAPAVPELTSVVPVSANQVKVKWNAVADADLAGYRLYKSQKDCINLLYGNQINWENTPVLDETTLTKTATEATVTLDAGSTVTLFKLTAVDTATPAKNESLHNTPLAVNMTGTAAKPDILCVMDLKAYEPSASGGFTTNKYNKFIMYYAAALYDLNKPFYSVTAKAIENGAVALSDADFVLYSTGLDGATSTQPAVYPACVTPIINYINAGGNIYLSGSNIAKSLADTTNAPNGQALLDLLGVSYSANNGNATIGKVTGSEFASLSLSQIVTNDMWDYAAYSITDSNDVLTVPSAKSGMTYDTPTNGIALAYKKTSGATIISGFAFESVRQDKTNYKNARTLLLGKILDIANAAPTLDAKPSWNLYE